MKKITTSEEETIKLGQEFVAGIKPGAVLGLVGELGAGKTQFVKGLAKGLGIKDVITSPTFVLLKKYNKLIHIDCYRLNNVEEVLDLGLEEYIKQENNIIVIEWADKIKKILPENTVWIEFKIKGQQKRWIDLTQF